MIQSRPCKLSNSFWRTKGIKILSALIRVPKALGVLDQSLSENGFAAAEVIILDVDLPDVSGIETCRRIKANALSRHSRIDRNGQ